VCESIARVGWSYGTAMAWRGWVDGRTRERETRQRGRVREISIPTSGSLCPSLVSATMARTTTTANEPAPRLAMRARRRHAPFASSAAGWSGGSGALAGSLSLSQQAWNRTTACTSARIRRAGTSRRPAESCSLQSLDEARRRHYAARTRTHDMRSIVHTYAHTYRHTALRCGVSSMITCHCPALAATTAKTGPRRA